MLAGRHQPREVRHVHDEVGAHRVGDLAEAHEVELARVGRPAGEQQLGLVLLRQARDLVHVEPGVLPAHAVRDDVVQPPREVELHAVREVAAVVELHAHDPVARLEQRVVDGRVGLRAGVRLHVGVLGAEDLLRALDGEPLRNVHVLAAAVIALARITLRVLVRQHRALAVEHRLRNEVL